MDKTYDHSKWEDQIYKMWEDGKYFVPKIDKTKKPFSIILPLPNANDPMHMGHALFTVQDILIRYHRMLGEPTLWLPGGDHAGIETQFVFEKKLAKEGKSRFDFDRNTLYEMVKTFAEENRDLNKDQMKRLGFSLDWTRYHYSMEPEIIDKVLATFKALHKDGLVYRAKRMANYCTKCGTAFSDLEVNHEEREDILYYLNYGTIQIATSRPETIFADVAVAVNPKDKRYKNLIGKTATIPIINKEIPIIADEKIQIDFGTGALKVTPAHDLVDYEIWLKHKDEHNLPLIETIDRSFGRMMNVPEKYMGMKVLPARKAVVEDLGEALIKTEPLVHSVSVCYRCGTTIEPMLTPQWYLKTKTLAEPAIKAVKEGKTKIVPKKRFEKMYFDWMENILDWNISRQIVWGPRIPVWYCLDCNKDIALCVISDDGKQHLGTYCQLVSDDTKLTFEEIKMGLQWLSAPVDSTYSLEESKTCAKCGGTHILQETDTFDTWFLSAQWPLNTLGWPDSEDFKYFYPTTVMDTLWDILFFWVARMMMLGIYRTGEVPFEVVHLHARVVDKHGQKMSKSKGNTINPLEMVEKYGADALRMALVYGVAPAADIALSEDKVRAMRNFANKVWNMGRFLQLMLDEYEQISGEKVPVYNKSAFDSRNESVVGILLRLSTVEKSVLRNLGKYRFADVAEEIYHFIWNDVADVYIEEVKKLEGEERKAGLTVLREVYLTCLKMLHPFMPFVTEALWQQISSKNGAPLIVTEWPLNKITKT